MKVVPADWDPEGVMSETSADVIDGIALNVVHYVTPRLHVHKSTRLYCVDEVWWVTEVGGNRSYKAPYASEASLAMQEAVEVVAGTCRP